ncbi:MBL fold metallo-hydrolase [Streptomyces halobius]|uniref:MBL fold metallo-hydrolase n=1 Tax=Streptomyces halobius TaxID=2879846 RepID=A0ABY4MDC5_9ACTN|nr:MBL fold metallo-hydrolase [Streptomyces halobius]UQA95779.1 MBL fold metallo-hydrolase [Streptomyces halobius]
MSEAGAPQVIDHRGGVWSIAVPIPDNPLGHTLVHLVETDRGPVLIDTGWDDPDAWDTLVAGVGACGFTLTDLHGVLITHHHPDHHGLSAKVREASGAWIAMHAADTDVVRRTREAEPRQWLDFLIARLATSGAPDDHLAPLREARAKGGGRSLPGLRAALPDREIAPGELLDLPGRRLRAIWTPGHTPGHVCLHLEEEHPGKDAHGDGSRRPGFGRLFSGDHLLPGITPHIGLYEDPESVGEVTDPLGDYLDSLERVGRIAPAEVLPAHQHAFTGAEGRVRELIAHHEERLAGLRALLRVPLTPWQLAVSMEWNRPWEQIPYGSRNIAVSEAEAHLRRLVKLGHAELVPGSDPATYRAV